MSFSRSRLRDLAILLAACIVVFWVRLGHSGLAGSEGFRVLPAWAMLEEGDYLVPRLYGQAYLRKPPGMLWAVAGTSFLLGETEFAARAVSALSVTLAAVLTLVMADTWFGRPRGVLAGLAYALTPLMWAPGRTAEIEALHGALVLSAALALIDMSVGEASDVRSRLLRAAWAGASLAGALLVKGPACIPTLVGVLAGACVASRSLVLLRRWELPLAACIGGFVFFVWVALAARRVEMTGVTPVVEEARFLWRSGKEMDVLLLAPVALASALPWVLSLPITLVGSADADRRDRIARTIGWAIVLGLVVMTVIGVDNARYAMPTIALVPMAYAGALWRHTASNDWVHKVGRWLLLHCPVVPILGILLVAVGYTQWQEHWRAVRHSGRTAGIELARALPEMRIVVADELLDTRPEMFHYAQCEARNAGRRLDVRWLPGLAKRPASAPRDAFVAIRSDLLPRDFGEPEWKTLGEALNRPIPNPIYRGEVHKFSFVVFRPGDFVIR